MVETGIGMECWRWQAGTGGRTLERGKLQRTKFSVHPLGPKWAAAPWHTGAISKNCMRKGNEY